MNDSLSIQLTNRYGLKFSGNWTESLLTMMEQACVDLYLAGTPSVGAQQAWMQGLEVRLEEILYGGLTSKGLIRLNPQGLTKWTIVHELAHAWDLANGRRLSWRMQCRTKSWGPVPLLHAKFPHDRRFWYHVGNPPPPCGVDQNFNVLEDFAESVTAFTYPKEAFQRAVARGIPYGQFGFQHFSETPRGKFIKELFDR